MPRRSLAFLGLAALVVIVLVSSTFYTVHQAEQALVLQFGEPMRVVQTPGLKLKLPFVQDVVYFDQRLLDYDAESEEVIAADQKRLVVDSFVRYRVVDPLKFFQAVGNENAVRPRLGATVSGALRRVLGGMALASVLSAERADIMRQITEQARQEGQRLGIQVVDVRIRRADLPEANSQAIFERMKSEREREAREARAQGAELAQRIRSRAERERTVILAEAQRQAQIARGQGEGESARIYADAFGRDKEFFAFYRSMQAYRQSFGDGTQMVISPDNDFFRFFRDAAGGHGKQ